jgi:hypothetical protein
MTQMTTKTMIPTQNKKTTRAVRRFDMLASSVSCRHLTITPHKRTAPD